MIYNNIQLASKLSSGCDYTLFKDGIKPMWEDSRNKRGGRWPVSLTKQQRHIELDHLWLETVSGGLGGRLDGEGSQGKRLGWCGSSGLKGGRGSLCPPGGLIPLLLGSSCCVSSGRALGSTARKCVEPSSTSEPRGTRLLCGHGRQRTRRVCYTLDVSTKSSWASPQRPSLGTRPTQTQPPRATP